MKYIQNVNLKKLAHTYAWTLFAIGLHFEDVNDAVAFHAKRQSMIMLETWAPNPWNESVVDHE